MTSFVGTTECPCRLMANHLRMANFLETFMTAITRYSKPLEKPRKESILGQISSCMPGGVQN